ncbi:MAG: MGMT family protein [Candidatus Bathyarchaeia archaeon]
MDGVAKIHEDIIERLAEKSYFEKAVFLAVLRIPRGKVSTYKRIAEMVGRPKAYRAVGNALHKNPLAPIIPCHRVVRSDGRIVGETIEEIEGRKKLLLEEGVPIEGYKVKLNEKILY